MYRSSSALKWFRFFAHFSLSLIIGGMAQVAYARPPCSGESFSRAPMTRELIFQEFSGAVLRISSVHHADSRVGTGYLIDSPQGYVLTALHVVSRDGRTYPQKIEATSPNLPGQTLHLSVVKTSYPSDVALLQVQEKKLLSRIRPIDIALHLPPIGTKYYTLGYPNEKRMQDSQEVEVQGEYGDEYRLYPELKGRLKLKSNAMNGWSGSPLIDPSGAAVATCTDGIPNVEAACVPLADVIDVLDSIPADYRVDELDRALGGDVGVVRLANILRWRVGNASNLTLYVWATRIGANPKAYEQMARYFACPILPAYTDRRLTEKVMRSFLGLLSLESQNSVLLATADQAAKLGRREDAYELSKRAAEVIEERAGIGGAAQSMMPMVVLMDSHLEGVVYCHQSYEKGRSNSDDIRDLLLGLPVRSSQISTHLEWHDYDRVLELAPSLIVVHASAFYRETQGLEGNLRLLSFLDEMQGSGAKILVYTRGLPDEPSERLRIEWTNLRAKVGFVEDAELVIMSKGHESCFHDPEVGKPFKAKIMEMLDLPVSLGK